MSEARAYARFQLRRFLGSWDWFWFVLVAGYAFFFGYSLGTVYFVAFFVFMTVQLKEAPGRGDTGFSSMQAYLVSRPVGRRTVYRWRAAHDLVWFLGIVAAAGLGLCRRTAEVDPSELVRATEPIVSDTFYLSFMALCALCALAASEALSPFAKVSRPQRALADVLFVVLAGATYAAVFVLYMLQVLHVVDTADYSSPVLLWSAAGLAGFFVVHRSQMWRRYDFIASPSQFSWWTDSSWRLLARTSEAKPAPQSRRVLGLVFPLFAYPALIWVAFTMFRWWMLSRRGGSVWEPLGVFGLPIELVPLFMISAFTYNFFYMRGQTSAYVISRPTTRESLARVNSCAFALSGLATVALLLVVGWYFDGKLGRGALFLPWTWLLFLYAGTIAMTWGFSSPTLNSALGLLGGIILLLTATAAILIKEPPEGWSVPLAATISTATAFALGALVILVADRHVRNADIG